MNLADPVPAALIEDYLILSVRSGWETNMK